MSFRAETAMYVQFTGSLKKATSKPPLIRGIVLCQNKKKRRPPSQAEDHRTSNPFSKFSIAQSFEQRLRQSKTLT